MNGEPVEVEVDTTDYSTHLARTLSYEQHNLINTEKAVASASENGKVMSVRR